MEYGKKQEKYTGKMEPNKLWSVWVKRFLPGIRKFFSGSPIRKLKDETPSIRKVSASLTRAIGQVEDDFIMLGNSLQQISKGAKDLSLDIEKAAVSIGEDSTNSLLGTIGTLASESVVEFDNSREVISTQLSQMKKGFGSLEKLSSICPVIEQTGLTLHVVGLNIAVESCRSTMSQEMFSSFVNEIKQLSTEIFTIAGDIEKDSTLAGKQQMENYAVMEKDLEKILSVKEEAEETVTMMTKKIEEVLGYSADSLHRTHERAKAISKRVDDVVVSIQYHDIIRQQIEHIESALKDLTEMAESLDGKKKKSEIILKAARMYRILKLQIKQLKEVIREIEATYANCENAFFNLTDDISHLVEEVELIDVQGEQNAPCDRRFGVEQSFTNLKSGLTELLHLIEEGDGLEERIRSQAGSAYETSALLSEHIGKVRGISMELHLKALNAIIKSAHLGEEGRTLEVLAQEVNKLSRQSNGFVSEVVDILELSNRCAKAMTDELDHDHYSGTDKENKPLLPEKSDETSKALSQNLPLKPERDLKQGGSLLDGKNIEKIKPVDGQNTRMSGAEQKLEQGIIAITNAYDKFTRDSKKAIHRSQELKNMIEDSRKSLVFLKGLTDTMHEICDQMEALTKLFTFTEKHRLSNDLEELHKLKERYTMKLEREIHDEHMGALAETPDFPDPYEETALLQEEGKPDEDEEDEEELGDNIELF